MNRINSDRSLQITGFSSISSSCKWELKAVKERWLGCPRIHLNHVTEVLICPNELHWSKTNQNIFGEIGKFLDPSPAPKVHILQMIPLVQKFKKELMIWFLFNSLKTAQKPKMCINLKRCREKNSKNHFERHVVCRAPASWCFNRPHTFWSGSLNFFSASFKIYAHFPRFLSSIWRVKEESYNQFFF